MGLQGCTDHSKLSYWAFQQCAQQYADETFLKILVHWVKQNLVYNRRFFTVFWILYHFLRSQPTSYILLTTRPFPFLDIMNIISHQFGVWNIPKSMNIRLIVSMCSTYVAKLVNTRPGDIEDINVDTIM